MKESLESALVLIGCIIVAEVINECIGYKLIEIETPRGKRK